MKGRNNDKIVISDHFQIKVKLQGQKTYFSFIKLYLDLELYFT